MFEKQKKRRCLYLRERGMSSVNLATLGRDLFFSFSLFLINRFFSSYFPSKCDLCCSSSPLIGVHVSVCIDVWFWVCAFCLFLHVHILLHPFDDKQISTAIAAGFCYKKWIILFDMFFPPPKHTLNTNSHTCTQKPATKICIRTKNHWRSSFFLLT